MSLSWEQHVQFRTLAEMAGCRLGILRAVLAHFLWALAEVTQAQSVPSLNAVIYGASSTKGSGNTHAPLTLRKNFFQLNIVFLW